jgi:hypothetical protein
MNALGHIKTLICTTVLTLGVAASAVAAPIVYMTGTGNPWGVTAVDAGSNEAAMNTAFGVNQWTKSQGFSMAAFAADTEFLFLDGSDSQANQFSAFLTANQAALTTYVSNGGTLILNSAPNQGSSFAMGFGATLNYSNGASSVTATQAGINSGIFNGIATTYTGSGFSHAYVTGGTGYISLLNDASGRSAFGVKQVGSGFVGFGGMTLPYFHQPAADSRALLANMLTYVSSQEKVNEVPEPASMMLIGLGLAGVAFARRRKA